jgi:hypothetical protein
MTCARALALILAAALPAAPAAAGTPPKPTCARELALAETSLIKTLVQLQGAAKAGTSERCASYRAHAVVVTRARDVFERCSTGAARAQDVGQMDGALGRVNAAIASTCATP